VENDSENSQAESFARRRLDLCIALLLFAATFTIFLLSPVRSLGETQFTMMLGHTVLHRRTFALDRRELRLPDQPEMIGNTSKVKVLPLEVVNGRVYKYAPPGSAVLSLPFLLVARTFGLTPVDANGYYDLARELRLASLLAALLMAAFTVVSYLFSRLLLPAIASFAVALAASLGTQAWSTASRVVEPDTWTVLLLMLALYLLAAHELGKARLRSILLASILSWCYFVHPTTSISIVAITAYLWLYHRAHFVRFVLAGLAWALALVAYSWGNFHQVLPNYFQANRLGFETFWEALPGNIISPSRGLLIYVPVLIVVGVMLIYYRRSLPLKRLVVTGVFVVVVHLLVISGFSHWWAGHSYGPRYWTSVIPWFVLLSVTAIKAMLTVTKRRLTWQAAVLLVLAGLGILIHARGGMAEETRLWNSKPYDVDMRAGRLWNWRYPQFLAGLVPAPLPAGLYPALPLNVRIDIAKDDANGFLWYGWSNPEPGIRWTDEKQAAFIFTLDRVSNLAMTIKAAPFVSAQQPQQRFTFKLNGTPLQTVTLNAGSRDIVIALPAGSLKQQNILLIECPDADSPSHLGLSEDQRLLGLAVEWIEFKSE
jgi:hypothetical protein